MRIPYVESVLLSIDKLGRKGEQLMKTGFLLSNCLLKVLSNLIDIIKIPCD